MKNCTKADCVYRKSSYRLEEFYYKLHKELYPNYSGIVSYSDTSFNSTIHEIRRLRDSYMLLKILVAVENLIFVIIIFILIFGIV